MVKRRDRVTCYDVAERAGVSQSTVSRALAGSRVVSEATRERIREIARSLNYHVDTSASSMRSGRITTVAVVVIGPPSGDVRVYNPFHYTLMAAICAAASAQGLETIVSFQSTPDRFKGSYEVERKALGVIAIGTSENAPAWAYFRDLARQGWNVVSWGAPDADMDWVGADNHAGGQMATRHLLDLGCRHIAFVGTGEEGPRQFAERRAGYGEAMARAGLAGRHVEVPAGLSRHAQGRMAADLLLDTGEPLEGIVAACDSLALGTLERLRERGRDVPRDVRLIGFDGTRAAYHASPSLSSIEPDFHTAGALLVERLLAQCGEQARMASACRQAQADLQAGHRAPVRLIDRDRVLVH
ncbi:MAG TPA: LacI family DNA-binding transcriptional regulator [Novosphingobium sp.]|nr:LacI family DNA-binding transcriptional regulator [Novosphingobium sp.]